MTMTEAHSRPGTPAPQAPSRGSAVVWIDDRTARVALLGENDQLSSCRIERGNEPESSYLAIVVRAIGDRERVVILGPGATRLALEREYVAIHPRPERLVAVEPADTLEWRDLLRRLRELVGGA